MNFPLISLPGWIGREIDLQKPCPDAKNQLRLAIRLSEQNVTHQTGGPFGAAIFDAKGQLFSVGVNRVVPENSSVAHAEIIAIMIAESKIGQYWLDLEAESKYILASSAQPCAMCFGAILWSGIRKLRYGASREDVQTFNLVPTVSVGTPQRRSAAIAVPLPQLYRTRRRASE